MERVVSTDSASTYPVALDDILSGTSNPSWVATSHERHGRLTRIARPDFTLTTQVFTRTTHPPGEQATHRSPQLGPSPSTVVPGDSPARNAERASIPKTFAGVDSSSNTRTFRAIPPVTSVVSLRPSASMTVS